jgi:steroid 5-alpha reductase family enzyme
MMKIMSLVHLYIILAIAVFIYMTIWFVAGTLLQRDDAVDGAWALGFILIALLAMGLQNHVATIQTLSLLIVTAWGLRLYWHLTLRSREHGEDRRYKGLRASAFPHIVLIGVGLAVWLIGIAIEIVADKQMSDFRTAAQKPAIMDKGLWRYSRHPNYFGEIMLWVGATLVAFAAGQWWAFIGPSVLAFLIIKVSGITPVEKHMASNKDYQAYKAKTPALVPFLKIG